MDTKKTDPVCGIEIDESTAAGQAENAGYLNFFCSRSCLEKFNSDPEQFAPRKNSVIGKLTKVKPFLSLAGVVVLFLLFGGWSMNYSMT